MSAAVAQSSAPAPLLPERISGWHKSDSKVSNNPADADAIYAAVLKEFAFTDLESATYSRPGRSMQVRAARFEDAGGAYGAFTFYKRPYMLVEKFGDQGASANLQVLFYRGNVLVEATLDRITAMSAAEMRELAAALPEASATARGLPSLPTYLPRDGYVKNTAKYVRGPAGVEHVGGPLPAGAADFNKGAEVALGEYDTPRGRAALVLIGYPTPQIAAAELTRLEGLLASGGEAPRLKRSGPMVALVKGGGEADARALLAAVEYEADVTWSERVPNPNDDMGRFLMSVFMFIGVLAVFAVVAGVAFGGLRILVKRFFPDRVFDRRQDVEIIRLDLSQKRTDDDIALSERQDVETIRFDLSK